MTSSEMTALEIKTGCLSIDLGVEGLAVFFEPQYRKRIVIAGIHGATDINYEMAMELSKHLKSLAEMYLDRGNIPAS